ncbi:hypothetical protein IW262DRAFT_1361611, partial [Armillaria fumosa]
RLRLEASALSPVLLKGTLLFVPLYSDLNPTSRVALDARFVDKPVNLYSAIVGRVCNMYLSRGAKERTLPHMTCRHESHDKLMRQEERTEAPMRCI